MPGSDGSGLMIITGNQAMALGAKLSRVQVVAAYPITPQTPVTETLAHYVESGELDAQYVNVESEHSAMSVCIGASSTGARAFTATSANGLAYMCELIHWAAGGRLPIVMGCVNRAMAAPWSVLNDQQDSMSQRDAGWIQLFCRNNQEILDTVIQAYRIAETVYVPVMVCYDGYILSHTVMPVEAPTQGQVDRFLPPFSPRTILDPARPKNINQVTFANPRLDERGVLCHGYMELRHLHQEALEKARETIAAVDAEYALVTGRSHGGLLWEDRAGDAEVLFVAAGSIASEATVAVDQLRDEGIAAGVVGIRSYRPFPGVELRAALRRAKLVLVFDKSLSYGNEGPICADLKAALYGGQVQPAVRGHIAGLGGRDVKAHEMAGAARTALRELELGVEPAPMAWLNCQI
ncbi:MAG: pyruvate ferredoxin oxidoreductase [Candidatus Hydrogenedentes bacterium]|nr:pyruvate ferredoxin oxidoreductase [Candidatus Hydrogenedentota bacterium]